MLNKPTNVSPYNTFIDINDGLELKFSLSNSANRATIDIYDEKNILAYHDVFQLDKTQRNFSLPIPNAKTLLKNGNNYYWEMEYLNAKETNDASYQINGWDTSKNMLGVFPYSEFCTYDTNGNAVFLELNNITKIKSSANYSIYITFESSNFTMDTYKILKKQIGQSYDAFLYFYKDDFVAMGDIDQLSAFSDDGEPVFECSRIYTNNKEYYYDIKEINSDLEECEVKILFAIEDAINSGDAIKLLYNNTEYLYTVNDVILTRTNTGGVGVYNNIPSYWLVLDSPLVDIGEPEVIGQIRDDITVTVQKIDQATSPSYYFSCRDKMSPSVIAESGYTPLIRMYARFQEYPSVNYYQYKVYKLNAGSNWGLVWESDKLVDFDRVDEVQFDSETSYFRNALPNTTYKIKLVGQTQEGMDFESEEIITTEDFLSNISPSESCISFNKDFGCVEINTKIIASESRDNSLQIFRYDVLKNELNFVASSDFAVDCVSDDDGHFKKLTNVYDFNVVCGFEYIYYIFMVDSNGSLVLPLKSTKISPSWYGVYLTDLKFIDNKQYKPDKDKTWFVQLNYEPSDISRNYQVAHPIAINQKYPKSVRGKARFKTGSVSGLIGGISRSDDYIENVFDADNFDDFCANGNLKLLRSSTKGECLICDIDSFDSSVFGYDATMIQVSYTQIDDITGKQISAEV